MPFVDVRTVHPAVRLAAAERVRILRDFVLPELEHFNNEPCPRHATLDEGAAQIPPCRRCGIRFRNHQRVGVAWLYLRGRGLIADQVGTGKTAQAAGLIALLKQTGELDTGRVVCVVRPAVLDQWVDELRRFLPRLTVVTATGTRRERINRYAARWDVLVTGFQMFCRDLDLLDNFTVNTVVVDDVDPLRNHGNQTAYAIKRMSQRAARSVVLTGTPLQKRLEELHSVLEAVGGNEVLGTPAMFRRRYVREELVTVYSTTAGRRVAAKQCVGYRNLDEFKARIGPYTLRRTAADIDDVDLPAIAPPNNIYLDLYPAQQARYEQLRQGILKVIKASGAQVRHTTAATAFLYGAQICSGLATLGEVDAPGTSVKLDWVQSTLVDGDLSDEKVVVFCQFTNTVAALRARLARAGVGTVVIWGRDPDRAARVAARNRFWDDPHCRVLIGTSAIEQGLNLQVARHIICLDLLLNPARMQQLVGRIRRDGSAYRTVYVHHLLARATQEEGYMSLLEREQALSDFVWDEDNQLFNALHPLALLELIGASGRLREVAR